MSHSSQSARARPSVIPAAPPQPISRNSSASLDQVSHATTLIPLSPRNVRRETEPAADEDEKKCWICFVTESEEERQDWRAPCKCSLVAHESCLLEWIADLWRSGETSAAKLKCPQCKTPIRLKQDHSAVLDVVDAMRGWAGKAAACMAIGGFGSAAFVAMTIYGVNTVFTLCGEEYASDVLLDKKGNFVWTWRTGIGLPLVPIVLVGARTRAFDSVLPLLPVMFVCNTDPLHLTIPPSPEIGLALLPYVRFAYAGLWKQFVAPYETQWAKEVTPAHLLQQAEPEQGRQRRDNTLNRRRNRRAGVNPAFHNQDTADFGDLEGHNDRSGEIDIINGQMSIGGSNITTLMLGALLWPSVAKLVGANVIGKWPAAWGGEKLRRYLPSQLVRNIVGGLMVVVLKDIVSLYCKYKRAKQSRTRKVLNFSEVKNGTRRE